MRGVRRYSPPIICADADVIFMYGFVYDYCYHISVSHAVQELEHADIIFVYDYCYYISWVGDVHSFGRDHLDGPGDVLFAAYSTMMQTAAWKKYDGGNFAFYDPHPGFMAGALPPKS